VRCGLDQISGGGVDLLEGDVIMPLKSTIKRARRDKRQGKSASTQAGEFIREQMDKIRQGEHGARSPRQAIAIGLSEARRAGVALRPPKKGRAKAQTRRSAASRSAAARKAARTKGAAGRSAAARKPAQTRARHRRAV
jgi:hypothetical protein